MSGKRDALPPKGVSMKRSLIAGVVACAFSPAFAEDISTFDLGTLTVTPTRFDSSAVATPFNVVVITQEQIQQSPARSIPELLADQAGFHITNTTGTPDYSIDLRGFGVTGDQNALVLLDGQRLNDPDLSSVKWSSIPLAAIERIEIVRGSGSVLYGDNATAGTIHIITKAAQEGRAGNISIGAGSYEAWKAEAEFSAAQAGTGLHLVVADSHSDGYRANNAYDQASLAGDFRAPLGSGRAIVKFGLHDEDLRLPGYRRVQPPTINDLQNDRRGTPTPSDYGTTRGGNLSLGTNQTFGTTEFAAELGYRRKDQAIYNPTYPSSIWDRYAESSLDQLSFTPRIKSPLRFFGLTHTLVAGIDLMRWDYTGRMATSPATLSAPSSSVAGDQLSRSAYLQLTSPLTASTLLAIGGRAQHVSYRIDNVLNPALNQTQERSVHAYEVALRHKLSSDWSAFGKIGRSFRISTINENYDSFSGTVSMLEPQKSLDREIGVEFTHGGYQLRASAFRIDLRDELSFDAITFSNVNLAPTRREGLELEGRMHLTPATALFANYAYTVAKFREGVYGGISVAGNDVPVVPRHAASLGGSVSITPQTLFSASIRYVGEQRFDNDQTNDFGQKMPSYTTVDVKLSHRLNQWTLSASINNLLNEKYYTYAVRSTFTPGTYNAYPMPERNVWLSAAYTFK